MPSRRAIRQPPAMVSAKPTFPPRRDFVALSVRDLLDAREAYHVHLRRLENVVATAIGRYRIHHKDWYANHAPHEPRPSNVPLVREPRTLANSLVRPWSWPAVLVFVRQWESRQKLGNDLVPRTLYLSDGRVVPTCVVMATPDESLPPPVPGPTQPSGLIGGGYQVSRRHQGETVVGTVGGLVQKNGTYYALTSRHVSGTEGESVSAWARGDEHPIGTTSNFGVGRIAMSDVFPSWPGARTLLNLDAGLVRIDRIDDWTAQAFGIGEVGEVFDATEDRITLDMIGCPVRAYGGTSGVIEGEIQALFFRYETVSGFEHVSDVLIGPRTPAEPTEAEPPRVAPFTRPGDSGTLWFYDPPLVAPPHLDIDVPVKPERGRRARRLQPIAMQWGGERTRDPDGRQNAYALGAFVSTIERALEVELVRDWSIGHDEYWGKLGHFAIGWKACQYLKGRLATLMQANQDRIGWGDETLKKGSGFKQDRDGFVPLADVPDYVWINSRPATEPMQHFADIDIYDVDGGPSLLERGHKDATTVAASVWKAYFDGFAAHKVGPDAGCLPFRVWQIWEAMVEYTKKRDVLRLVAAAGVMAHYVGDASQPLHCSYLHHGRPPMVKVASRSYPIPKKLPGEKKENPAYTAFKKTRAAKIHAVYEETMLEVDTEQALKLVNGKLKSFTANGKAKGAQIATGHDAAVATLELMYASQKRLPPTAIIAADDPSGTVPARANALWKNTKVREATVASLADSVKLLANLWTAAWKAGNGDKIADAKLLPLDKDELDDLYRHEKGFVPSLSLAKMAQLGIYG